MESTSTECNVCPSTSLGSLCCIALTNLEIHSPCIKLLAPLRLPCLKTVNAVELVGEKRDTPPVGSKTERGTHTKQRQFVGIRQWTRQIGNAHTRTQNTHTHTHTRTQATYSTTQVRSTHHPKILARRTRMFPLLTFFLLYCFCNAPATSTRFTAFFFFFFDFFDAFADLASSSSSAAALPSAASPPSSGSSSMRPNLGVTMFIALGTRPKMLVL